MKKIIKIEGMTCKHCAARVESALTELNGVLKVRVNLTKNEALVKLKNNIDNELIIQAINETGYKVIQII